MNAWWLILIVPVSMSFGVVVMGMMCRRLREQDKIERIKKIYDDLDRL